MLIKCPECQEAISSDVEKCPKCGVDVEKKILISEAVKQEQILKAIAGFINVIAIIFSIYLFGLDSQQYGMFSNNIYYLYPLIFAFISSIYFAYKLKSNNEQAKQKYIEANKL